MKPRNIFHFILLFFWSCAVIGESLFSGRKSDVIKQPFLTRNFCQSDADCPKNRECLRGKCVECAKDRENGSYLCPPQRPDKRSPAQAHVDLEVLTHTAIYHGHADINLDSQVVDKLPPKDTLNIALNSVVGDLEKILENTTSQSSFDDLNGLCKALTTPSLPKFERAHAVLMALCRHIHSDKGKPQITRLPPRHLPHLKDEMPQLISAVASHEKVLAALDYFRHIRATIDSIHKRENNNQQPVDWPEVILGVLGNFYVNLTLGMNRLETKDILRKLLEKFTPNSQISPQAFCSKMFVLGAPLNPYGKMLAKFCKQHGDNHSLRALSQNPSNYTDKDLLLLPQLSNFISTSYEVQTAFEFLRCFMTTVNYINERVHKLPQIDWTEAIIQEALLVDSSWHLLGTAPLDLYPPCIHPPCSPPKIQPLYDGFDAQFPPNYAFPTPNPMDFEVDEIVIEERVEEIGEKMFRGIIPNKESGPKRTTLGKKLSGDQKTTRMTPPQGTTLTWEILETTRLPPKRSTRPTNGIWWPIDPILRHTSTNRPSHQYDPLWARKGGKKTSQKPGLLWPLFTRKASGLNDFTEKPKEPQNAQHLLPQDFQSGKRTSVLKFPTTTMKGKTNNKTTKSAFYSETRNSKITKTTLKPTTNSQCKGPGCLPKGSFQSDSSSFSSSSSSSNELGKRGGKSKHKSKLADRSLDLSSYNDTSFPFESSSEEHKKLEDGSAFRKKSPESSSMGKKTQGALGPQKAHRLPAGEVHSSSSSSEEEKGPIRESADKPKPTKRPLLVKKRTRKMPANFAFDKGTTSTFGQMTQQSDKTTSKVGLYGAVKDLLTTQKSLSTKGTRKMLGNEALRKTQRPPHGSPSMEGSNLSEEHHSPRKFLGFQTKTTRKPAASRSTKRTPSHGMHEEESRDSVAEEQPDQLKLTKKIRGPAAYTQEPTKGTRKPARELLHGTSSSSSGRTTSGRPTNAPGLGKTKRPKKPINHQPSSHSLDEKKSKLPEKPSHGKPTHLNSLSESSSSEATPNHEPKLYHQISTSTKSPPRLTASPKKGRFETQLPTIHAFGPVSTTLEEARKGPASIHPKGTSKFHDELAAAIEQTKNPKAMRRITKRPQKDSNGIANEGKKPSKGATGSTSWPDFTPSTRQAQKRRTVVIELSSSSSEQKPPPLDTRELLGNDVRSTKPQGISPNSMDKSRGLRKEMEKSPQEEIDLGLKQLLKDTNDTMENCDPEAKINTCSKGSSCYPPCPQCKFGYCYLNDEFKPMVEKLTKTLSEKLENVFKKDSKNSN